MRYKLLLLSLALISSISHASAVNQTKGDFVDKFRQLEEILPTPNRYRSASGEPGRDYWQQQVDYKITAVLDETKRHLSASQQISYTNNSPETLKYLWLQLEQNRFKADSMAEMSGDFAGIGRRGPGTKSNNGDAPAGISFGELRRQQYYADNEPGYEISDVRDSNNKPLPNIVVGAQMRIDLPSPLKPGQTTLIKMDYQFNILEEDAVSARAGYEHFPDDERDGGNDIFLLAQWFPRVSAYSDYEAWHNKEFLGRGEFTLEFGDYDVSLTVPDDHIVAATGVLQNPKRYSVNSSESV